MTRIYLCGPMTDLPAYNYPAFHAEAARLRALGWHVENPAENPAQESWSDYLRVALTQMLTCDMVALLPGWESSEGATLEVHVASALSIEYLPSAEIDCGPE